MDEDYKERLVGTYWKVNLRKSDGSVKFLNSVELVGFVDNLLHFRFSDSGREFFANPDSIVDMFQIEGGI